jgi:hypothetical protein
MAKKNKLSYMEELLSRNNPEMLETPILPIDPNYGDSGLPSSALLPIEYDKYARYLSNNGQNVIYDSPETWDEKRALRQGGFEKFYNSLGQGVGTFATTVGSTAGVLLGLPYAAINAATTEGDQNQLDDIINNPVVKGFSTLDKYLKEDLLPTYYTKEQQNSLLSAATGTDLINGVGFLLSNIVPASLISKGFGRIGSALTKSKLGKLTPELQTAVEAGTITVEEAGQYSSLIKGIEKTGDITSALVGRFGESAMEANSTEESIIQNLTQKRAQAQQQIALGQTPDNPNDAYLTDDQIKALAKEQRDNVFGANMLLAASDFYQAGRWFGKNPLLKDIQQKGLKYAIAERGKGEALKDFFKEALQESGEEGFQFLAQKGGENAAKNGNFWGEFSNATNDLFTTIEGQKSMLLGAVLGGGAGAVFNALNGKERKDRLNALVDNANANPTYKDRYIINAKGKRVLNPEFASSVEKFTVYEAAKQAAKEVNDEDSYNLAEKLQFADLVSSRHQIGRLDDLLDEIKAIGDMDPTKVQDFFGEAPKNPVTGEKMTPSEIAANKIQEAKDIAKAIDGISQMKEFANLTAAGRSHIVNKLVHQDVLKKQYVDINKKISEIKPSEIQVSAPSIAPIETALNENPTEGKNPLDMKAEVINEPVETKETYSALDQTKLDNLNKKKQSLEEQYSIINEELKKYAKDPKAADIVAEESEINDVDKEVLKQQKNLLIKNKLEKYQNQINEKATADQLIPEEYKLLSAYNESLFLAKNAKDETILRNSAGKDVTYRLANEDFKVAHISEEAEDEELEDDSLIEDNEPWQFQKTTIFTSAGRNSTAPGTFNSQGDRQNLGLSLGRKAFYKAIRNTKGKLSLKLEVAPEGMYPELFTDDEGNPTEPTNLPVIIGYLYRDGKQVEVDGIRAYNVIHHDKSNHQFISENPQADLAILQELRETVIARQEEGLNSFVYVTEISNGFLNITESPRPLKDVLDLPIVKANGPTIKISVISPNTKKPVIVENGKEVANVKWSGRPYLRVKTGTSETGSPIYAYQELDTRNLTDFEIENVMIPLIERYLAGNDTVELNGKVMQILSYNTKTPSILDMFLTFGRTGNYSNSIFFEKTNKPRVLKFGTNENGEKLAITSETFKENVGPLIEFLQGKKRAISRKYTEGGVNISQNLFLPIFTAQGAVLKELSYLDLISGKDSSFETALLTRLSSEDVLLNQYTVFDPIIRENPNTTIGLKKRKSVKPVENTDEDTEDEYEPVDLTKPINTVQFRVLSNKDQTTYIQNMLKNPEYGVGYSIGTPVPQFNDLFVKHDALVAEGVKNDTKFPEFLDFAKAALSEEEFKELQTYINPSKPVFGKKKESKKTIGTTKYLNQDDTALKVGSLVKYNNKNYIVYSIDGTRANLRNATDKDTLIDVVTNLLEVIGSYPVVSTKKQVKFIVTSDSRLISSINGNNVFEPKGNKKLSVSVAKQKKSLIDNALKQVKERKENLKKIYVSNEEVDLVTPFQTMADFESTLPDNLADADADIAVSVEVTKVEEASAEPTVKETETESKENKPESIDWDDFDPLARQESGLPYKVGDVKSASNWLQKTLGVTPTIAEGIITVAKFDKGLFGYFYNGAITLSDILEEGTEYHEAYHLVSMMYLAPSQRKSLYNEVRKREGNKNLTDKQAEEILAEDFREYVMTDGKQMYPEVQKNIFQKMLDFIKWIFGSKQLTVNELFNRINEGYYNQKKYIQKLNNGKTDMFGRDAGHIFSPSEVFKVDETLSSIFSVFLKKNNLKIYNLDVKTSVDQFEKYATEQMGLINSIFNVDPKYFLKRFKNNLLAKPDFDFEVEFPEELRKKDSGSEYQDSNRLSGFTGVSDNMNVLFSIISDITSGKDPETNQFRIIPSSEVKAYLADTLHDVFTYKEMIQILTEKATQAPNLQSKFERRNSGIAKQILYQLKDTDTSSNSIAFKIQFQEAMTLVKQAMLTTIHYAPNKYSNGNAVIVNSMKSVIEKRIKEYWTNSVMRSPYISNVQGLRFIEETKWKQMLDEDPRQFFTSLGIEFRGQIDPSVLGLINTLKINLNKLPLKQITLLKGNKETEVLVRTPILFGVDSYYDELISNMSSPAEKKPLTMAIAAIKDAVKNLAALEVTHYNSTIEAQSRNTEGETVYAYSKPSFIFQQIKRIKEGTQRYNTAENSVLWDSISENNVEVSLVDGSKYNGQGEEGIHISEFTEEEMLFNKILNLYNSPEEATIQFLQMADKKSVPGLTINKTNAQNLIYNPSEITISENGTVTLSPSNRAVKRLWDMYLNYQKLDQDANISTIKTYGKAVDIFEEVNNNKPYETIDEFAKGISLIITNGVLDTLPFATNFVGVNKDDKTISILPENVLVLSDSLNTLGQIRQIIAGVVTTEFVNNLDQMNVFFGNPIFYKALFKRTPEVRSNGRIPSVDDFVNEYILDFRKQYKITEEQRNAMPIDGTYKTIIGKDPLTESIHAEEFEETLGKDFYGKEKVNPTDGQGMSTFYFYLEYGIRTGQLYGEEFQKAVEAELKGLSSNYPFPPLKLVHYGRQVDQNEFVPAFYKFSIYPLLPSMIKGRNLEKINEKLLNSGAGLYIFDSGVKDGNPIELDTLDKTEVSPNSIQHVNLQDLKIQVDINPKYDKFLLLLGSQIRKLINQNNSDAGVNVRNKELIDSYEKIVNDLIRLEAEMLADSLGEDITSLESGIISQKAWENLIEMFKESAIEREESDNLIMGLDFLKKEGITIDVLPNRNKIQNLMNAFINNKILKQNMRGRAYVQCSSVGFEYTTEKDLEAAVKQGVLLKDSEFYRSHFVDGKFDNAKARLGFIHVKENKVVTAEILLPYYFKELGLDINNIDPKLLEALGYRIPTQGLNSMLAFKVVGFLPKSTDQLVAVPYEITTQSGSDFDVDKLNTLLRNYILKNKVPTAINQDEPIPYSKVLSDLIEKGNNIVLENYDVEELEELEIEDLEKIDTSKLDEKIKKLKNKEDKKHRKIKLQEKLFDIMYANLTTPEMMFDYINPNSADNLEEQAKEINNNQTTPYKKTTEYKGYRQFLTSTNIKVGKNFWSAKAGVGQAASQGVFTALTQLYPIVQEKYAYRLFIPDNQIIREGDKIVFGKINNAVGKSIIDLIANQHLSANVDAASKPFVFQLNANLITNDVHYYLIAATVPETWVNKFLTQPIIIDYVNEMEKNKGIVAKKRRALFNIYRSENDIITSLFAKYGRSYDVSEYIAAEDDLNGLKIPIASSENRKYTEEQLMTFMKNPKEYGKEQVNILDDFLFYKQFASERRNQIGAIKFDTEGAGKNLPESKIIKFKYGKILEVKLFSGLNELVEKSFLNSFRKNVLELTLSMYANSTVVETTDAAQEALMVVMQKLYAEKQLRLENIYKVYGILTNTILQNNLVTTNQAEWWNQNMLSSNSIAAQVSKLINSKELENNYLFQNLLTIEYALTPNEPDIIRLDNTVRIDNDLQKVIYESFKLFGNLNPRLYQKMIEVSLFQTGVIESPVSFYKYIPVDDFVNVVSPLIKRHTGIDSDTFLSVIYQNLPTVKGLVKSVRYNDIIGEKNGLPDSIEVPNNENYDLNYLLKKSKNKIGLYEKKGQNKNTFVFQKIPIKSNLKFYNTLINSTVNIESFDEDIIDIDYVEVTPEVKQLGEGENVKTTSFEISKIKLMDGNEYSADKISGQMLIDMGYSFDETNEILKKICK